MTEVRLPPLHDVRDPEALCHAILKRVLDRNTGFWSPEDREEIFNDMRELILQLADRFDPSRSSSFEKYAAWILTRRVGVDVYRKRLVDTRYHERRAADLSLDELRERLDYSVAAEESDELPDREQSDLLTRLAVSMSSPALDTDEAIEKALDDWLSHLTPEEEAA